MNFGQINGYGLNSTAQGGNNAILSGGTSSFAVFTALLVAGALLTGGLFTVAEAGGRVSKALDGGLYGTSEVGGIQFKTANLQGGIHSLSETRSNLGIAMGLNGGVESGSGYGGQVLTHVMLQVADNVGDASEVGGLLTYGSGLNGGTFSNSWLTSQIIGGAVLVAGGLSSTSLLDGTINTGRILSDGLDSTSTLTAGLATTALLQGGLSSSTLLDQGLSISPHLQDGVISVGVVDSPVMRINAELDDGIGSNTEFVAQIIISPNSNYGVDSNSEVSAGMRKFAVLTGGFATYSFVDSIALKATQRLPGGLTSAGFVTGLLRSSPQLQGGNESVGALVSSLVASPKLSGGMAFDAITLSDYRITARLQDGASTGCSVGGLQVVSSYLNSGTNQTSQVDGNLLAVPLLTGGITSNESIGSDIVQGFKDPLLNTWALSIVSATQILSIETPLQDI